MVSAAGKAIVLTGGGTIHLSGATAAVPSTFGKLTINGGSTVGSSGFLNASSSSVGVGDSSNGTLNVTGGVFNAAIAGTTFFAGNNATGAINVSGGTLNVLSTAAIANIFIGGTFNGTSGGSGVGSITISNTGIFSTGTTMGILQLGSSSGGTGTGTINLNGGTFSTNRAFSKGAGGTGTINFNGGTLQATGTALGIPASVTTNILTGGATIDTQTFADAIATPLLTGTTTDGGLTKLGTGTLTLTGASTYTGGTVISAGTLQLGNAGATGSLATGSAITDNGTLAFNRANVVTQGTDFAAAISGTGGVTQAGGGTLTLNGTNTYSGNTVVSAGTLEATNTGALPGDNTSGKVSAASGGTLALAVGGTGQFTSANVDSVLANAAFASGSALGLDTTGGNFTYGSNITGTGVGLTKLGANTLTLTGTNTYTGTNTIAAGTLNLGSAQALGGTGTLSFTGGILQYSAANQTDYGSRFSSAAGQAFNIDTNGQTVTFGSALASSGGSLTKLGAGTLILGNNSTYSGVTTISAGTLQLGAGSTTGSVGTGAIVDNATLSLNHGTAWTLSNNISGSGTVTQIGSGAVTLSGLLSQTGGLTIGTGGATLSGANTYTGVTTLNGGAMTLTAAITGTSAVAVNNTGTVVLGANDRINDAATVTLNGGTINTGGFQEGRATGTAAATTGLGTLTLSSSSTLDFGSGHTGSSVLAFAGSSGNTWSGTLTLADFTVGTDELNFASATGLNALQLSEISLGGLTATGLDSFGDVLFTAVPEPATWGAGLLMLGALGYSQRRQVRRWLGTARPARPA